MTADVKKLKEIADPKLNGGLDAAAVTTQQTAYLAGSFRFRGIFTPKFRPQKVDADKKPMWQDPETKKKPLLDESVWKGYGVEYEPLRDFIKKWIDGHTKGLVPSLVTALRENYKVTPAGAGATHNTIMGANNNLQGALGALPAAVPAPKPTPTKPAIAPKTGAVESVPSSDSATELASTEGLRPESAAGICRHRDRASRRRDGYRGRASATGRPAAGAGGRGGTSLRGRSRSLGYWSGLMHS